MLEDCITKLQKLDRHYHRVNEMTPAMHEEFEKALIELLQHSVCENQRAVSTIRKLQNELELTKWGLKTLLTRWHNDNISARVPPPAITTGSSARDSM